MVIDALPPGRRGERTSQPGTDRTDRPPVTTAAPTGERPAGRAVLEARRSERSSSPEHRTTERTRTRSSRSCRRSSPVHQIGASRCGSRRERKRATRERLSRTPHVVHSPHARLRTLSTSRVVGTRYHRKGGETRSSDPPSEGNLRSSLVPMTQSVTSTAAQPIAPGLDSSSADELVRDARTRYDEKLARRARAIFAAAGGGRRRRAHRDRPLRARRAAVRVVT